MKKPFARLPQCRCLIDHFMSELSQSLSARHLPHTKNTLITAPCQHLRYFLMQIASTIELGTGIQGATNSIEEVWISTPQPIRAGATVEHTNVRCCAAGSGNAVSQLFQLWYPYPNKC